MELKRFPPGAALWAVLALSLALRLAAATWWQNRLPRNQRFEFGDSETYWVLAEQIAHGKPYQYGSPDARVFRMPGYPVLLAGMLRVFGDDMPVVYARWLSAIFGTAAVAGVYGLAATLFDKRIALLAAIAAACYPGAIAMSIVVLSEAPFCPLYLAQLTAWLKSWQSDDRRRRLLWAALAGVLGGVATLMRPDWLLFVPFAAAIGLWLTRDRRRHLEIAAVMLLAIAAIMAPWWWRNFQIYGRFIPTTLQVGASLYDGLNPRATGGSDMWFFTEFLADESHNGPPTGDLEYRVDRRLWRAGWQWAASHPGRAVALAGTKFVRMWNIWPNDPQNGGRLVRLATAATYLPAIALALVGIWQTRRRAWPAALAWLPAVYLTLLHLIFVSSIRYREPPMLALLVFSAAVILRGNQPSSAR